MKWCKFMWIFLFSLEEDLNLVIKSNCFIFHNVFYNHPSLIPTVITQIYTFIPFPTWTTLQWPPNWYSWLFFKKDFYYSLFTMSYQFLLYSKWHSCLNLSSLQPTLRLALSDWAPNMQLYSCYYPEPLLLPQCLPHSKFMQSICSVPRGTLPFSQTGLFEVTQTFLDPG